MGRINYDTASASVEWFEQGETKGKEIDLVIIQMLNPDIDVPRKEPEPKKPEPAVVTEQPELRQTRGPQLAEVSQPSPLLFSTWHHVSKCYRLTSSFHVRFAPTAAGSCAISNASCLLLTLQRILPVLRKRRPALAWRSRRGSSATNWRKVTTILIATYLVQIQSRSRYYKSEISFSRLCPECVVHHFECCIVVGHTVNLASAARPAPTLFHPVLFSEQRELGDATQQYPRERYRNREGNNAMPPGDRDSWKSIFQVSHLPLRPPPLRPDNLASNGHAATNSVTTVPRERERDTITTRVIIAGRPDLGVVYKNQLLDVECPE